MVGGQYEIKRPVLPVGSFRQSFLRLRFALGFKSVHLWHVLLYKMKNVRIHFAF